VPARAERAPLPSRLCGQVGGGCVVLCGVVRCGMPALLCCRLPQWLDSQSTWLLPGHGRRVAPPHRPACPACRCLLAAFEQESDGGKILGLLKQLADGGDINQVGGRVGWVGGCGWAGVVGRQCGCQEN
jgi:hypothetical protein